MKTIRNKLRCPVAFTQSCSFSPAAPCTFAMPPSPEPDAGGAEPAAATDSGVSPPADDSSPCEPCPVEPQEDPSVEPEEEPCGDECNSALGEAVLSLFTKLLPNVEIKINKARVLQLGDLCERHRYDGYAFCLAWQLLGDGEIPCALVKHCLFGHSLQASLCFF